MLRLTSLLMLVMLSVPQLAQAQGSGEPAAPGSAEPSAEPTKQAEKAPSAEEEKLNHKYQVGLGVRSGTGFRVIVPYGEENCGEADKSVCGGRQPVWLELSPSFGISSSLELLMDVRFYLEGDISASKGFFIAPGFKYYTEPDDLFKFFLTGQVVLENQDQAQAGLSSFDIGIRSALGLQFDILRYVGLYVQGGMILAFKRWLTFTVDLGGGVQFRY